MKFDIAIENHDDDMFILSILGDWGERIYYSLKSTDERYYYEENK